MKTLSLVLTVLISANSLFASDTAPVIAPVTPVIELDAVKVFSDHLKTARSVNLFAYYMLVPRVKSDDANLADIKARIDENDRAIKLLNTLVNACDIYNVKLSNSINWYKYLVLNPDVNNAFNMLNKDGDGLAILPDGQHLTREQFAKWHYFNYGSSEGRSTD